MSDVTRRRELGRGERVLPGVWRLRLPLSWPGVPHVNAWALAWGSGIVLVDCGAHEPGSLGQLERALDQVNLSLDQVRLLVCTHAHADHYGQAGPVLERTGCELWMHPAIDHVAAATEDPDLALARRLELARNVGVPDAALRRYAQERQGQGLPIAELVRPHRGLGDGDVVDTDHGAWRVVATPGHAPSHLCLYQPDRRVLISGDQVLGRISLFYDYGWTPDPAGEYLASLDRIEVCDARLCLSGHGRPFSDVRGHIDGSRALASERIDRVAAAIATEPLTAYEVVPRVYGDPPDPGITAWWLQEALCYLRHLEITGRVRKEAVEPERWSAVAIRG